MHPQSATMLCLTLEFYALFLISFPSDGATESGTERSHHLGDAYVQGKKL